MKRPGSRRWLERHVSDAYVRKARRAGLRSRAAYKLEELDRLERLFRPGQAVAELGAAPGGWTQYLRRRLGPTGRIVAVDLLPIAPIEGVTLIQGDFADPAVQARVGEALGRPADLVISDLAPNISGVRDADDARCAALHEAVLDFARRHLAPGGILVLKVFEGAAAQEFRRRCTRFFASAAARKPGASRAESREFYLVCRSPRFRAEVASAGEELQNGET
jgi:23S rRNA (uridine2552-2'-O)-methyltransferase